MRITSIILNTLLLITVILLITDEGWPDEFWYQVMVIIFFAAPVLSLFTLFRISSSSKDSWLSLYFQRKRLEEKAKIDKLTDGGG